MIALPLFAICQSDRPTSVHGRDHETWQDCPWPLSTARPPSRPLWHSVQPSCITHYTRDRHTYTHTHTHTSPAPVHHAHLHARLSRPSWRLNGCRGCRHVVWRGWATAIITRQPWATTTTTSSYSTVPYPYFLHNSQLDPPPTQGQGLSADQARQF